MPHLAHPAQPRDALPKMPGYASVQRRQHKYRFQPSLLFVCLYFAFTLSITLQIFLPF